MIEIIVCVNIVSFGDQCSKGCCYSSHETHSHFILFMGWEGDVREYIILCRLIAAGICSLICPFIIVLVYRTGQTTQFNRKHTCKLMCVGPDGTWCEPAWKKLSDPAHIALSFSMHNSLFIEYSPRPFHMFPIKLSIN